MTQKKWRSIFKKIANTEKMHQTERCVTHVTPLFKRSTNTNNEKTQANEI